ncbi:CLUMA_CG019258, isoform A [Clunio marinus]|uniref:CLUMA_CG019258, isoform A n=1 Tax=Clunio marinus TaxID=568069 RepID=A0A1J1J249_9DIPT|nr:CLUMA_CG019258, isoform A [Clunio marinus]
MTTNIQVIQSKDEKINLRKEIVEEIGISAQYSFVSIFNKTPMTFRSNRCAQNEITNHLKHFLENEFL